MRALFLHDSADGALTIYDQVTRRWGRDAGRLRLPWAHLQLQQAIAHIMRAESDDWADARSLLVSAEETANDLLASPPENSVVKAYRWQARIIKSIALNYRGYLDRQEGRYLDAVHAYQQSAMLQRRLGMAALVSTLTNLAYVMALLGESHHARLMAEEAERRARRSGKEHMLAMTLNVRALVEAYDDRHKAALRYTDRALDVAAKLPSPRVRGLIHLTRARAHRYLWDSLSEADRESEPAFFPDALKEANQAVKLLRNNPADRVEALLERGCIFRDLAHRQMESGRADEANEFASRSQDDLKRAAVLAGAIDMPRKQALAYTNMGWLYYYLGQASQVEESLGQACRPFPREYLFGTNGPLPSIAKNGSKGEAKLPFWNTLGKVEMLRAYLDLDQAAGSPDRRRQEERLMEAAEHITLSLAYGELVAESHFDLNKAEKRLHQRFLQDNLSIRSMHTHAQRAALRLGMEQPTRFQGLLNSMFGPADLWV
jgi:tetratricopeptide (TPR) repeat protein